MIEKLPRPGTISAYMVIWGLAFLIGGCFRDAKTSRQGEVPVSATPQTLTFKHMTIFDGKTEDGFRFADYIYKSSDCLKVSDRTTFFNSAERAEQEIEKEIKKAATIRDRGAISDDQGQTIGERVVLEFEHPDHAEIVSNIGQEFHSISAPSLHHALEFEKARRERERISTRIDDVAKVTFTASGTSEGRTEEGFPYSETRYFASDCETVTVRTEYFDSAARAHNALQKRLKEATNVIEQRPKLSASGQQAGDRVVAMFKAEPGSEYIEDTVVAWTENSTYYSIRGLFTHVLEFEKRNYR